MFLKWVLDTMNAHMRWIKLVFQITLVLVVVGYSWDSGKFRQESDRFVAVAFIREDQEIANHSNRLRRELEIWIEGTHAMLQQMEIPFYEVNRNIMQVERLRSELEAVYFDQRLSFMEFREMKENPVRLRIVMKNYLDTIDGYGNAERHMRNKIYFRRLVLNEADKAIIDLRNLSALMGEQEKKRMRALAMRQIQEDSLALVAHNQKPLASADTSLNPLPQGKE